MPKNYRISEAEWIAMEVVWQYGPAPASELIEHLKDCSTWHSNTIRTMLDRLAKKGVLKSKNQNGVRVYSARIGRDQCVRQESRSLINRIFGGNPKQAIIHLLDEVDLTPDQYESLCRMLETEQDDKEDQS